MIARDEEGKLDITLLEVQRPLSEEIIKEYDHKEVMKDIHNIFVQLQDNFFEQAVYQEYLKYTITEDLEFVIVEDPSLKIKNINENNLKLGSEISFKRFTKKDYKKSIDLCEHLLMRVRDSFYNLDEIEKYVIKNFEYDKPKPLTDEIIIFETKIHKDKYYRSKKSAYIKMALQLGLMDEIKMDNILVSELKKYISKNILTIEN